MITTRRRLRGLGSALVVVAVATACGGDRGDDGDTGGDAGGGPTLGPTSTDEPVVATFQVHEETFKVELTTPELEDHARRLLAGEGLSAIPLGLVIRDDAGVNEPWSWHIEPSTLEFAFMTTEVCDGLPSHVEEGVITSDQYCPWSAELVAVEPE